MNTDIAFAPLDKLPTPITGSAASMTDPWQPIVPVPEDSPQLPTDCIERFADDGFEVTSHWPYVDEAGRLLGHVVRYDRMVVGTKSGKMIKPFTFCEGPSGRQEWRCKGFPEPRPLYGLDRLAARPSAPVLVVEGEKSADSAAKRFPDYVVVTSSGGARAARKTDWSAVADQNVIIWPDADDAGTAYADDVADMARSAGAVRVHTVKLPVGLPVGWDLADPLPAGLDDSDIADALSAAEPASVDGPLPLFPPLVKAERYPVEALGPVLSRAAAAIARKVQVPEAIAAQSVLGAAALAAQAHADVLLPYGQTRPLSLFLVTIAGSGERKSSADTEALWPIMARVRALAEEREAALPEWNISQAAWLAQKKRIETRKELTFDMRKEALQELGPEPDAPLHAFLTASEPTFEGLVKAWLSAPAALGIFTAEGGQFIGGHGMAPENKIRTAADYSKLWDGSAIDRIRSLDGVSILRGRRLSMHLMAQRDVAARFLSDPVLRDQGLLSRVLVAAPESIAGSRFYRDPEPDDDRAIQAYGARILSILEAPWPLAEGRRNELEPRKLLMSPDAVAVWKDFYDHVEGRLSENGDLRVMQDFASKIAENAARIAGVLTIVDNHCAAEINVETMRSAVSLAGWYVEEALRLQNLARTDTRLLQAQQVLDWLHRTNHTVINFRDLVRLGPSPVRTKAGAEKSMYVLAEHGWVEQISSRPRRFRVNREETRQ